MLIEREEPLNRLRGVLQRATRVMAASSFSAAKLALAKHPCFARLRIEPERRAAFSGEDAKHCLRRARSVPCMTWPM
jgi:hypothetical protein